MAENTIEIWWTSLPISEKERIAKKGLTKAAGGAEVEAGAYTYPHCTAWWNNQTEENKQKIYIHCVNRHGDELKEWDNANPYGD